MLLFIDNKAFVCLNNENLVHYFMKPVALFILLILSNVVYSQKLKDKLQGDWVCTKIVDSFGIPSSGKFGASHEYLKFSFKKSNLFITEAPFDHGIGYPIDCKDDLIELFPDISFPMPEKLYYVQSVNSDKLILKTIDIYNSNIIVYHFTNQATFIEEQKASNNWLIDNGTILIKQIRYSKENKEGNRVADYKIPNLRVNMYPSPTFEDKNFETFGSCFSYHFKFPASFPMDSLSEELIVDFDLFKGGATNLKIIKGLGDEMNASVLKALNKSAKKWKPLIIDGLPIQTTMRFHFVFYDTI